MIEKTVLVSVVGALGFAFLSALAVAVEKQDEITCRKLKKQSVEFAEFYSTPGEKQMCNALGITLTK